MKLMKKFMKKSEGFTLVELIVVIAILAILAGVAIPVYSGYINKANEAADQQKLEAVETAMSAALAMKGEDAKDAASYFVATFTAAESKLTVTKNSTNPPANSNDVWKGFCDFYGVANTSTSVSVVLQYHTAAADIPDLLGAVDISAPAAG